MVTAPKPVSELVGLVYSETPKEQRTDPDAHLLPWYQSPTKLAGISLVLVVLLLQASLGSWRPTLLVLFTLSSRHLGDVLTSEIVAQEIVRTLVGGIGLVSAVPITTALAAFVADRSLHREPVPALLYDGDGSAAQPSNSTASGARSSHRATCVRTFSRLRNMKACWHGLTSGRSRPGIPSTATA